LLHEAINVYAATPLQTLSQMHAKLVTLSAVVLEVDQSYGHGKQKVQESTGDAHRSKRLLKSWSAPPTTVA